MYIFLFDPKIWPNNMLGKKIIERERKKGGKCIFFPQLVKSTYAYFFPNWLKINKIAQKKYLKIFRLRRAPPHYIKYHLGKKYKSSRGGGQNEFQIYIHPCNLHKSSRLLDCLLFLDIKIYIWDWNDSRFFFNKHKYFFCLCFVNFCEQEARLGI